MIGNSDCVFNALSFVDDCHACSVLVLSQLKAHITELESHARTVFKPLPALDLLGRNADVEPTCHAGGILYNGWRGPAVSNLPCMRVSFL